MGAPVRGVLWSCWHGLRRRLCCPWLVLVPMEWVRRGDVKQIAFHTVLNVFLLGTSNQGAELVGRDCGCFGLVVFWPENYCFLLMRMLEVLAVSRERVPAECVRRVDASLLRGSTQLASPLWYCADRVEALYSIFKERPFR